MYPFASPMMMGQAVPQLETVQSLPFMTANNAPAPHIVSADTEYNASQQAWRAFDSSGANTFWSAAENTTSAIIQRDFPSAIVIGGYAMTSRNDQYPNFTAGGWNASYWNGSAWVQFDGRTGLTFTSGERKLFTLAGGTPPTSKVRWVMSPGPGGKNPSIGNIEILQYI